LRVLRERSRQGSRISLRSSGLRLLTPDLPTPHESGLTDYDVTTWTAFFLSKGAPKEIVAKLNQAAHAAMDAPAVKARYDCRPPELEERRRK
jgi:tripartite-type tricarboxylate transporter receptor subunit TctC